MYLSYSDMAFIFDFFKSTPVKTESNDNVIQNIKEPDDPIILIKDEPVDAIQIIEIGPVDYTLDYIFPSEIWRVISDKTPFLTRTRLTQVCRFFNKNLQIINLCNIEKKYIPLLTNDILKQYPDLIKLNLSNNRNVTDINHLTKLNFLDASGELCVLADKGIEKLNLQEIDVTNNLHITKLNHMNKLKVLTACYKSALTNNGIKKLNLRELDLTQNSTIDDINCFRRLRLLTAKGDQCAINNDSIKNLNLCALDASGNPNITNINHMKRLQILMANGLYCGLHNGGIIQLKLKVIFANDNSKISRKELKHMTSIIDFFQEIIFEDVEFI